MPSATMTAASTSAWSGLSVVDNTYNQKPGQVVLNNSLAADHGMAGLDNNQSLGDIVDIINRGTKNLTLAAEDTTAAAKDRFTAAIFVPAAGKVRVYYNGTRWEPFLETVGGVFTKTILFTENATSTSHVGSVILPPTATLARIVVLNQALWTATGAVTMKVGDTAVDNGYFTGINLKATDLLLGEVLATDSSTNWGGKEGAYLVAATGVRGPVATNFGAQYVAGSTITGTITVASPATAVGRTYMIVKYSVPTITAATAN